MKPDPSPVDEPDQSEEPSWIEKLIVLIGLASFFIFLILLMKLAMLAHEIEALRHVE